MACALQKTAANLTDVTIQSAIDSVEEVAGSAADFIVCSSGVKRAYQDYLITNRSNIDVMNLQGGYKAISYNGIPVVGTDSLPKERCIYSILPIFICISCATGGGSKATTAKVIKQVANKPLYTATLVKYADMICDRPIGRQ